MDLITLGAFVLCFVLSAVILAFIFSVATKEQTYEEGLRLSREKFRTDSNVKKRVKHPKRFPEVKLSKHDHQASPDKDQGRELQVPEICQFLAGEKKSKKVSKGDKEDEVDSTTSSSTEATVQVSVAASEQTENHSVDLGIDDAPEQVIEDCKESASSNVSQEANAEEPQETIEEPVISSQNEGVTLTSAGKAKNKEKKRMAVEEVAEAEVVSEPRPSPKVVRVPVSEPPIAEEEAVLLYNDGAKESGQSQQALAEKTSVPKKQRRGSSIVEVQKKPQLQAQDLLSAVKKTTFDGDELQDLIDILLNKQQGNAANGGWVEHGGHANVIKHLEKALNEKKDELSEESTKVKSLTERYHQVRQELNLKTQQLNNSQRDLGSRHHVQVKTLESRVQQEIDQRHHEVARLQQQLQFQMHARLQEESQVKTELEKNKNTSASLEHELTNVRSQMGASQKEVARLQSELSQAKNCADELNRAKEEVRDWERKCSEMTKVNREAQVEELAKTQHRLEAQLNEANQKVLSAEQQVTRLSQDNDRLSEQLASAVERPKADGQESGSCNGSNNNNNGDMYLGDKEKVGAEQELQLRCRQVETENEGLRKEIAILTKKETTKTSMVEQLSAELEGVKGDLNSQRTKNDEEAKAAIRKEREEAESSHKKLIVRLFPELELDDGETEHVAFSAWMEGFAAKFASFNSDLRKVNADEDEKDELRQQVQKYKTILKETESVLHDLQSSAETSEVQWKDKMSVMKKEIDSLKLQLEESTRIKLAVQEQSLSVVNTAEEMQEKLKQLQDKLVGEEEAKRDLKKNSELQSLEREKVQKELESERKIGAELGLQIGKLNQVITAGQEALQQEQKTVELLRELLSKHEKGDLEAPEDVNDDQCFVPETVAAGNAELFVPKSEVGSVASLSSDNSQQTPTKDKKSTKKKLLGLIKKHT